MPTRFERAVVLAVSVPALWLSLQACSDMAGMPCDDSQCDEREECSSPEGRCVPVGACGRLPENGCLDPTEVCDPLAAKCYPGNGDCSAGLGCPSFSSDIMAIANVSCDAADGLCHVAPKVQDPQWLTDLASNRVIVDQPKAGGIVPGSDALVVHWISPGAGALVRIIDRYPVTQSDFVEGLVWGASVPPSACSVAFSDGYRFDGGWIEGEPASLDEGTYYLVVIQVSGGHAIASSVAVPFAVGESAWPEPGASCSVLGVPGDCYNPAAVMGCFEGTCTKVCASHVDCDSTVRCGAMVDGVRFCGVLDG